MRNNAEVELNNLIRGNMRTESKLSPLNYFPNFYQDQKARQKLISPTRRNLQNLKEQLPYNYNKKDREIYNFHQNQVITRNRYENESTTIKADFLRNMDKFYEDQVNDNYLRVPTFQNIGRNSKMQVRNYESIALSEQFLRNERRFYDD